MSARLWLSAAAVSAFVGIAGMAYVGHLRRELTATQARLEAAEDAGSASALTVVGERATAQRVEVVVRLARAAEAATSQLTFAAHEAPDADQILPAERALRLRSHDDELCRLSPVVCRAATAADPAGGA